MDRKYLLSVLVGVLSAAAIAFVLKLITYSMYPYDVKELGELVAAKDIEGYRQYLVDQPVGSFLMTIASHGIGLLGGLMISRLIFNRAVMGLYIITSIILLTNTVNFLSVPNPTWFPYADLGFSLIVAFAYISSRKKA
jgi:hypothetical protein